MASSVMKFPAHTMTSASLENDLEEGGYFSDEASLIPTFRQDALSKEDYLNLRRQLETAIPKMHQPKVALSSFVGLDELKEDLLDTVARNRSDGWDRLLIFGPTGSGKSHFARALTTEMKALLFVIDQTTLHGWAKNLELFTKIFADMAWDASADNGNEMIVLLMDNFDWVFSDKDDEKEGMLDLLNRVQDFWDDYIDMRLVIVACSYTPWKLDMDVVDSFHKRVYLRPLNSQERREMIQKKSSEMLLRVGLDLTDKELGDVVKRVERFAGWEICEMIDKMFRLQCPSHIKRQAWLCNNVRPFNKFDFEITLDRMTTGSNERRLLAKFKEFNNLCGDAIPDPDPSTTMAPKHEDKAVEVQAYRKKSGRLLSKFFGRILL